MRSLKITDLVKKGFPMRFLLARLTRLPVIGKIMDHLFFEGDDMVYIPRNIVQVNKTVESQNMVIPSQIVEYFIEKANYHWIMNTCICRESAHCTNYPVELGCLFLGEAAMGINPELGRKVTRDQALEHVKKCREHGLVHLIGRNKLDAVWLNVGPGNKLLTICNCCPCCCLWRMLPDLESDIRSKVRKMPGVTVTVTDACTGCGMCDDICFVNAITVKDGKAAISDQCRGCGRCITVCPQEAIRISINDECIEKAINRISKLVDIS